MKRIGLCACILTLLLISGCGSHEKNARDWRQFRENINSAQALSMKVEVTADIGGKVMTYTLAYTESGGESSVEVLAPELIAGIRARFSESGAALEYDGLVLDTGEPAPDGLTPISALPALAGAFRSGHVESLGSEISDGVAMLTADVLISESSAARIWLDAASRAPLCAEIRSGGRVIVRCEFLESQF